MTPPNAAAIGSAACLRLFRRTSWISRLISMPTTRKKTVIKMSLIEKCSALEKTKVARPIEMGVFQRAS